MPFLKREPAREPTRRWKARLPDELAFWKTWLESQSPADAEDCKRRLDPEAAFREHLQMLVDAPAGSRVDVLDVGAGPLTLVGAVWPERQLHVTAIDPLADQYNEMLGRLGITPPIRTQRGDAEHLLEQFPRESFDLVYSCNALDHSYNPASGIVQMYALTKRGGMVRLEHNANEGKHQRYQGLHQWNFDAIDGRFIVWNKRHRHAVDEMLPAGASVLCERFEPGKPGDPHWLNVTIRKPLADDVAKHSV